MISRVYKAVCDRTGRRLALKRYPLRKLTGRTLEQVMKAMNIMMNDDDDDDDDDGREW